MDPRKGGYTQPDPPQGRGGLGVAGLAVAAQGDEALGGDLLATALVGIGKFSTAVELIKMAIAGIDGKRDQAVQAVSEVLGEVKTATAQAARAKVEIVHQRDVAIEAINTRLKVALAALGSRTQQPATSADNVEFHKDADSGHMAPNG